MKNKLISFVTSLLVSSAVTAQLTSPLVNTPIPPSPNSATFRQFAGYTPNLATGTVNVPIPLYDIKVGDFTLPLSMQYYTQGIKMTDDPYPLGYGWILSPGLRITRTIMGRPDMYHTFDVQQSPEDPFTYGKKAMYDYEQHLHSGWDYDDVTDTQHDVFTLHLPHGNYTFFLKKNAGGGWDAVTTDNLLKIEVENTLAFKVTDGNGIVYHFGGGNLNDNPCYELYHGRYATSWMVRQIVLPGINRTIDFEWEGVYQSALVYGPFLGGDVLEDHKEQFRNVPDDTNPTYTSASELGLVCHFGEYNEVLHLKQVRFPGGQVDFTYKSRTNPLLEKMKVTNMFGTAVRQVDFGYGTGRDERLLTTVDFSDEGVYTFNYHTSRFDGNLNAQDWWGYYNAKANRELVPQVWLKSYNSSTPGASTSYQRYGSADRSIDATAMQANMLTRVTYPTGGYTAFEYEPHKFNGSLTTNEGLGTSSRFRLTEGGGLRVKKMTSSAGGNAPVVEKNYTYGTDGNGLANVIYEPTLETFIDELNAYNYGTDNYGVNYGYNHRNLIINSQSNYMRGAMNTPALWYPTVTESVPGEGKTVYTYSRKVNENTTFPYRHLDFDNRYPLAYNNLFSKGCLLTEESVYGSDNKLLRKTTYDYAVVEESGKQINDVLVTRTGISRLSDGPDLQYTNNWEILHDGMILTGYTPNTPYLLSPLTIRFFYERLNSMTTVDYSEDTSLTTKTNYTYSGYQVASRNVTTSGGSTMTEEYYYPKDYAQAPAGQQSILTAMRNKNILEPVFKTVLKQDGSTRYVRNEYALFHNSFYRPSKVYSQKGSNAETLRGSYEYDNAANLCGITRGTLQKTAVAWGYGSTLPVAVVEGTDYASLVNLAGTAVMNGLNGSTAATVNANLATLRSKVGSTGLVTSCTHQPLVGMLTQTDPNGNVTEYVYDNAWRLDRKKDKDGKTVELYTYKPLNESGITLSGSETNNPVVVQFSGISQSGSTASAQIVCEGDCQVTFYLMGEVNDEGGVAEYMLDGNYYSYTGAFGEYVTLNLTEGSHRFTASISGAGFASLYINAVNTPNTLGGNLTIQANY